MKQDSRPRRQLHLWITECDHDFLLAVATEHDTSVCAVVRSLIRQRRRAAETPKEIGQRGWTADQKADGQGHARTAKHRSLA
jgi:hypothetical protein